MAWSQDTGHGSRTGSHAQFIDMMWWQSARVTQRRECRRPRAPPTCRHAPASVPARIPCSRSRTRRGTAAGSRPSTRPSPRGRFPRTCESPARRPRVPARISLWFTGGCRFRGMHDRWPWGPSRRSWRLGAALPRRDHPGSREVPLGPRPRDKFHSLSSGHIV